VTRSRHLKQAPRPGPAGPPGRRQIRSSDRAAQAGGDPGWDVVVSAFSGDACDL